MTLSGNGFKASILISILTGVAGAGAAYWRLGFLEKQNEAQGISGRDHDRRIQRLEDRFDEILRRLEEFHDHLENIYPRVKDPNKKGRWNAPSIETRSHEREAPTVP